MIHGMLARPATAMPPAPTVQRKAILRAVIAVRAVLARILAMGSIRGRIIAVLWLLILRLTAGDE